MTWASYQIRKIAGCACAGNAGNVFPRRRFQRKLLVSDPGMHHGTCVTHVPWCMSGSLTCGDGENVPGIPRACAPAILRIWQEAHVLNGISRPHPKDPRPRPLSLWSFLNPRYFGSHFLTTGSALILRQISGTNIILRVRISNFILIKWWDVITHSCLKRGFIKPNRHWIYMHWIYLLFLIW